MPLRRIPDVILWKFARFGVYRRKAWCSSIKLTSLILLYAGLAFYAVFGDCLATLADSGSPPFPTLLPAA